MIMQRETLYEKTGADELKARLYLLLDRFAVERRQTTLASGLTSNVYIDCRQIYFRAEALYLLGELFFKTMLNIETESKGFDACGGMAMGSIPLACALSLAAFRRGRELPGFAVRKQAKDHGMMTAIEGDKCLVKNGRMLMLEDVITTGSSVLLAVKQLREAGMTVDTVFSIVDREQGGRAALTEEGLKVYSLFTLKDLVRDSCG
jgi:orotate phosphoribosyltransferase